ncbi:hypothetical protein [Chitinophaga caseinilytica]|uniref:Thioredoxin family protein n=1 Tax=Chitinophaga caseinilytica TaxID=2267521 RepID=A0ABZ2Z6F1_9BACT
MKPIYYFVVIIALGGISYFTLYKSNSQKKRLERSLQSSVDSIANLNTIVKYLEGNIAFANKYTGFRLEDTSFAACKVMNENDAAVYTNLAAAMRTGGSTLILRYTEIGCGMCSDMTVEKMKAFKKEHPETRILALVDFSNVESYLVWRKGAKVDFDVYFYEKGRLSIDADSPTYSYLFYVDGNLRIRRIFIPNSGYPELIDDFLTGQYKFL